MNKHQLNEAVNMAYKWESECKSLNTQRLNCEDLNEAVLATMLGHSNSSSEEVIGVLILNQSQAASITVIITAFLLLLVIAFWLE